MVNCLFGRAESFPERRFVYITCPLLGAEHVEDFIQLPRSGLLLLPKVTGIEPPRQPLLTGAEDLVHQIVLDPNGEGDSMPFGNCSVFHGKNLFKIAHSWLSCDSIGYTVHIY